MPYFFRGWIILFALSISWTGHAQSLELSNYLSNRFTIIFPDRHEDLKFDWNMAGHIQTDLNAGLTDLSEDKYRSAIQNFNSAIANDQTCWPAYYYRGIAYKSIRLLDSARLDLEKVAFHVKQWQVYSQLGEVYHAMLKLDLAEKSYKKAMELAPDQAVPVYQLGKLAFIMRDIKEAKRWLNRCHDVAPNFAKAYVVEGLIATLNAAKGTEESLTYFDKAIALDSACMDALFWRGLTYIQMGQASRGVSDLNVLIRTTPNNIWFLLMRGFLHVELEQFDLAFLDLRKAVMAYPDSEDSFKGEQSPLDKRIDIQFATSYAIRNAYGIHPDAEAHFKKGFCLFLVNRKQEAIDELKKAEKIEHSAVVHFMQGIVYEHMENHLAALQQYSFATGYDKDIFDAHKKRALYFSKLKQYDNALVAYSEMIRIQPELAVTYRLRGLTKIQMNDWSGAIEDLARYNAVGHPNAEALFDIAYAYQQMHNMDSAISMYQKASVVGRRVDYFEVALKACIQIGDTTRLNQTLDLFVQTFPNDKSVLARRVPIYIAQKKFDVAEALNNEMLNNLGYYRYNNGFVCQLYTYKGMILSLKGEHAEALESLSKAKELSPGSKEVRYQLGLTYLRQRDLRQAAKTLKELSQEKYKDSERLYQAVITRKD